MNFTHEIGNLTTTDGMIVGKRVTYYANNPCILIDRGSGTLLKMGDSDTNPLDDYYKTAVAAYTECKMQSAVEDLQLIRFDRYGTLNIDEICTLINYFMQSVGPGKMESILSLDETELKAEIARLAKMGF